MAKATSRKKPGITHWEMISDISREVRFNTDIPEDMYHGLEISRFPSQIQLAEFRAAPYRERVMPRGVVAVTNGLDTQLMIVPESRKVIADARLSLYYGGDRGPEHVVEGYFSNGGLVSVNAVRGLAQDYITQMYARMGEDTGRLKGIFGELLEKQLEETDRAFRKIQGLVRNSDLPYHYRDAVEGIL